MEQGIHNSQFSTLNSQSSEFDEIRPYEEGEMKQAFEELLADRQFSHLLKGFVPWLPKGVRNGLLRLLFTGINTPLDFQKRFMKPVVKHIIRKHTDGCTFDDQALPADKANRYTFLSNHRDIVLDSAFLDVMLVANSYPTTVEIGIGDNLLIYPWIKRLVRMNKAFTVRRGLTAHEMMRSSQLMSSYIHYAVTQKHENIWIAQREGRAKDSSDHTQDSVLKMLAMGGEGGFADKLRDLNIVPLTISYEYDPCDYLKAAELQRRRDEEHFQKLPGEDVLSMQTGIMGYKGKIHYHAAKCIDDYLLSLPADTPRTELFDMVAEHIDREIHRHYRIYANNYVALDMLRGDGANSNHYSAQERKNFEGYIEQQLQKIQLAQPDWTFLRQQMLLMYANPLINHLNTLP